MARSIPHEQYIPGMGRHRLTALYDPLTSPLGIPSLHRMLVGQAGIQAGQRVLEIGCGTGKLSAAGQAPPSRRRGRWDRPRWLHGENVGS